MEKLWRFLGIGLTVGGVFLIALIYLPVLQQEVIYQEKQLLFPQTKNKELIPVSKDFGIVIPKIDVNAEVFANVDANNPKEYLPILVKGVAQAKGSSFPGQNGTVFIFAHSSDTALNIYRYNAVFYLIGKLGKGDEIKIYYKNEKFVYKIINQKILNPANLEGYVKTLKGKVLVLQTCYPPGTTLQRLIVIAEQQ